MGISISGGKDYDVTVISNCFIDHFMPHANGAYVKVYLYLLRCLSCPDRILSVSSVADFLEDTEGDILRALSWLENHDLLRMDRTDAGEISRIHILEPDLSDGTGGVAVRIMPSGRAVSGASATSGRQDTLSVSDRAAAAEESAAAKEPSDSDDVPDIGSASDTGETAAETTVSGRISAAQAVPSHVSVRVSTEQAKSESDDGKESSYASLKAQMPTYSKSQIRALSSNEEVKWTMNIAERYLERLLNPADIQLIIYLYESVGFPAELILYLYEYCASKEKKNPSYIEAVALKWADQGIRTVEEAEAASLKYNTNYNAVSKAFGLNRMPGAAEQQYIDRWAVKLGFDTDMIEEACSRSLLSTQRPDFKYADKILENWHKKGVRTKQDIAKADQLHSQNAAKSTSHTVPRTAGSNKFNAFPQRSYTGEDYSTMEQRLLNRQG